MGVAGGPERGQGGLDRAEGVEQRPLAVGVEQGAGLVLAVDVDEPLAEGLEGGDRHGQAVGMGGRPARRGDPAGEDQVVVVDRAAEDRFEVGAQLGVAEVDRHGGAGLVAPVADQVGRRLAAEDQAEGGQEQALARAGLAGPRAIAGAEVDPGIFDERQVLHG